MTSRSLKRCTTAGCSTVVVLCLLSVRICGFLVVPPRTIAPCQTNKFDHVVFPEARERASASGGGSSPARTRCNVAAASPVVEDLDSEEVIRL